MLCRIKLRDIILLPSRRFEKIKEQTTMHSLRLELKHNAHFPSTESTLGVHWIPLEEKAALGEIPLLCMELVIAGQLKEKETNKKKSFLISLIWVMSFLNIH